ncbi:MAG: NAD-dependent epimerase/dehydratase family protein, partial [Chloroflexota bacterium]
MDDSKTPILVTGATGFIGKRLIDRLLSENIPVIGADLPGKMPAEWHGRLTY